jgi:hypothetical protein
MLCTKHVQLSQHYEAALRRWSQADSSLHKAELSDTARRLGQEVEMKALEERNAAYARMLLHKQNCSVCNAISMAAKKKP